MLVTFVLVWVAIGAAVAFVMARRGHTLFTWFVLGVALGPLVVPLAIIVRSGPRQRTAIVAADRRAGQGDVMVLAGIDGSAEAVEAVHSAVRLLGNRIQRVCLVAVVSVDAAENTLMFADQRSAAERWLTEAAAGIESAVPCDQMVVTGLPADAIRTMAKDGYDLIVVGRRGRGLSTRLFGSVATELARSAPVPVLLGDTVGARKTMVTGDVRHVVA